ncbi:hypothetical protein CYMTET_40121 [Cymbomonas tetramitiformis]|uniref:Uncharacterized protein n=1 Tax=Cymbomonas tetramitiformis TaxID=36881 RepID=A0AAE0F399_9CHLO|nr:hypothetical protein CYMTET_40121 [Cymbomonas tetramitiformis]
MDPVPITADVIASATNAALAKLMWMEIDQMELDSFKRLTMHLTGAHDITSAYYVTRVVRGVLFINRGRGQNIFVHHPCEAVLSTSMTQGEHVDPFTEIDIDTVCANLLMIGSTEAHTARGVTIDTFRRYDLTLQRVFNVRFWTALSQAVRSTAEPSAEAKAQPTRGGESATTLKAQRVAVRDEYYNSESFYRFSRSSVKQVRERIKGPLIDEATDALAMHAYAKLVLEDTHPKMDRDECKSFIELVERRFQGAVFRRCGIHEAPWSLVTTSRAYSTWSPLAYALVDYKLV